VTDATEAASPAPPSLRPHRGEPVVTARSVLGLLRESLWIRLLIAVALLSVLFVFLGRWQYHRHTAKVARNAVIDANYATTPVPLADVLATPSTPLAAARQWTQVEVSGVYQPSQTVLVRNRPVNNSVGYEVIVPLRTPSGARFLVDRGWLPAGRDFGRPDTVPAPPGGTVTVVARLRPGEHPAGREGNAGSLTRIDLARLAALTGGEVYRGAYGVLAGERPSATPAPTLLPRPDEGLGPHLAYAVQWWLGAAAAWGLLGYYALREAATRSGRATAPGRREGRSRRREPTDEEWEDAATAAALDARPQGENPVVR
jgi:cytochrome oxidase assembly protein ShyY1